MFVSIKSHTFCFTPVRWGPNQILLLPIHPSWDDLLFLSHYLSLLLLLLLPTRASPCSFVIPIFFSVLHQRSRIPFIDCSIPHSVNPPCPFSYSAVNLTAVLSENIGFSLLYIRQKKILTYSQSFRLEFDSCSVHRAHEVTTTRHYGWFSTRVFNFTRTASPRLQDSGLYPPILFLVLTRHLRYRSIWLRLFVTSSPTFWFLNDV